MTKKYIGTFRTETEAALMFVFYSIALHGIKKASTNFAYKAQLLKEMIEDFLEDGYMDPFKYAPRVSQEISAPSANDLS